MTETMGDAESVRVYRGLLQDEEARTRQLTNQLIEQRNTEVRAIARQLAALLNRLDEIEVGIEVNGDPPLGRIEDGDDSSTNTIDLQWRVGHVRGLWEVAKRPGESWAVR